MYLAGIQGAAFGLGSQPADWSNPGHVSGLVSAAEAKMTRYLKGWKRILDKDNTNRCNWYEFQDADLKKSAVDLIFFPDGGV